MPGKREVDTTGPPPFSTLRPGYGRSSIAARRRSQAAASPAVFSRNNSDTHHRPAIPTIV